jgi:hypothetical protein
MKRFCLFILCLFSCVAKAQTVLLSGTYTDSLPPSPTCTYFVTKDITLQGNFDFRGLTFLLKSDFKRNEVLDKQTNNRVRKPNGRVFGTNIRLCKARVNIENCIFVSADSGMWGGIYLADSSSRLYLLQSKLQDSYHGIVQTDSSQVVAKFYRKIQNIFIFPNAA